MLDIRVYKNVHFRKNKKEIIILLGYELKTELGRYVLRCRALSIHQRKIDTATKIVYSGTLSDIDLTLWSKPKSYYLHLRYNVKIIDVKC